MSEYIRVMSERIACRCETCTTPHWNSDGERVVSAITLHCQNLLPFAMSEYSRMMLDRITVVKVPRLVCMVRHISL